eukprot:24217_1
MGVDDKNDDDEIIEIINETNMGNVENLNDDEFIIENNNETDMGNNKQSYNDEDIVRVVNKTKMGDDDDIIATINKTDMGDMTSVDTVKDYNVTKYEINEENDKGMENGENNELMEGVEYDMDEDGAKQVSLWLDSIGYSKYYDNFVQDGFDSMASIKHIKNENDLKDIGIVLKAHRLIIMDRVNELKNETALI